MPFNTRQPSLTINTTITIAGTYSNPYDVFRGFGIGFLRFWGFAANHSGTVDTNGALQGLNVYGANDALFSLIGRTFGSLGNDYFALPNLDDRAAISPPSNPLGVGQTRGAASASLVQSMLPVALGGTGTALPTAEPAQTIAYGIITRGTSTAPIVGFAGQILASAYAFDFFHDGVLRCDGSLRLISDFPELFAAIGTTYGGDGVTNFALPDLRGRVPVGAGNGIALGGQFGSDQIALTAANLPVEMGGSATPISNYGPSLGINFLVATLGLFPDTDGTGRSPPDGLIDSSTVGEIILFAGSTVPLGYALANGQLLSRSTYPQLNFLFGNTYGSGDAANFALPDLRGRAAIDETATSPVGTVSGSATTVLTMADIPALNLVGTAGDDTYYGGNLADTISGGLGADHLFGNGGVDTIDGGGGDDVIDGGTGADMLTGGKGDDVYFIDNVGDTVTELTGEGTDELRTTLASTVLPANFEKLVYVGSGSGTLDTGTGATGAIALTGGSGDDRFIVRPGASTATVAGGAGADTLDLSAFATTLTLDTDTVTVQTIGSVLPFTGIEAFVLGSGNDVARLGGGNFTVAGGLGDDIYYDRDGNDAIVEQSGEGNDTIYAGTDYLLPANVENLIYTGTGSAVLTGNAVNNTLDTGTLATAPVTLSGGDGDDMLVVRAGSFGVNIIGGAGVDTLMIERALAIIPDDIENITYIGTSNATLVGNRFDNVITGGGGDDLIHSGGGSDTLIGGGGNDSFYFGASFDGTDKVDGGAGALDSIVLQGSYSFGMTFGTQATVGIELIALLPGSDTRFADLGGASTSYNLTLVDANITAGATLTFQASTLRPGENFFLDASAESDGRIFTYGGFGVETITGGAGDDAFYFGEGRFSAQDRLDGRGGMDSVALQGNFAGANAVSFGPNQLTSIETIALLPSADSRYGNYASSLSYDITTDDANVAVGQTLSVFGGNLGVGESFTFNGSAETDGSFRVYGGLGTDSFTGGAGNDGFYFGPGKWGAGDTVTGGGGTNDQLALDGDFTISIGANADVETLSLLPGPGGTPNNFNITLTDVWTAAGATKTVWGAQVSTAMTIDGSAESNGRLVFFGGQGADTLTGGAGADAISGGGGGDALKGGAGADIFRYDSLTDSFGTTDATRDRILDFTAGDRIDLSRIDAITGGTDDAFSFIGNAAFGNIAGQLRFTDVGGGVFNIEGDVNGDGIADFALLVTAGPGYVFAGTDFVL
ncbi:tail fiber protein [Sphingomonas sp. SUN039]|uniref:tail fiber protein n=1 Tax=Sphingomonas sp. SUN039 TaxID=2937787 RepID=UPI002164B42B|nr:tail fiber protein [Sphingomonas sp. SUN039]UVO54156.1 tail fiber protein [Sphingomonas sp. SUN039]